MSSTTSIPIDSRLKGKESRSEQLQSQELKQFASSSSSAEAISQPQDANRERLEVLHQLLMTNADKFHILWNNNRFANHLSHGLIALYFLGASSERLKTFYNNYVGKLVPSIPSQHKINEDNWLQKLGKKEYYMDYLEYFENQIEQHGIERTLLTAIPRLAEGISGSAFHGLIQLGYAMELLRDSASTSDPEFNKNFKRYIGEGLAFWSIVYRSLGKPNYQGNTENLSTFSPLGVAEQIRTDAVFDEFPMNTRFELDRLNEARFQEALPKYDLPVNLEQSADFSLKDIRELIKLFSLTVLQVFNSSNCSDFFLLHGVTGMRSVKVILEYFISCLDQKSEHKDSPVSEKGVIPEKSGNTADMIKGISLSVLQYFWRALVCAYIYQGRPELRIVAPEHKPGEARNIGAQMWDDIIKNALVPRKDESEHMIKLTFVCFEEEKELHPVSIDNEGYSIFKEISAAVVDRIQSDQGWKFSSADYHESYHSEEQEETFGYHRGDHQPHSYKSGSDQPIEETFLGMTGTFKF